MIATGSGKKTQVPVGKEKKSRGIPLRPSSMYWGSNTHSPQARSAFQMQQENDLLDQTQLARLLGKSEFWVERCRWAGNGVPYVKIGRTVRYRRADVDAWLSAHTRTWTRGEAGGGTPAAA